MFTIGKLFHLTHVVSDLAAVDRTSPILSIPSKLLTREEALLGGGWPPLEHKRTEKSPLVERNSFRAR